MRFRVKCAENNRPIRIKCRFQIDLPISIAPEIAVAKKYDDETSRVRVTHVFNFCDPMTNTAMGQIILFLVIAAAPFVAGYEILAIFPFSGKSHFHMFRAIADALVDRGHNVTVVGHFPRSPERQSHGGRPATAGTYTDYSVAGSVPVFENFTVEEASDFGYVEQFLIILQDGLDNCEGVMSSGRLDELIRSRAKFDLVLVEIFNTGCFVSLANHFGAPIVGVTSTSLYPWYAGLVGDVIMPSYVPMNVIPFTTSMTFVERMINSVLFVTVKMYYKYKYEPKAQEIVDKYLGKLKGTISESMANVNGIITNTYFVFGDARPTPPGIIEVGGCTYKSPKPLPEDLERYVTSAERGVIYFSMGSIVKGSSLSAEKSLAMFRAFGRLKGYKVLWKWEDDQPPSGVRPDNVMLLPWMPQFDVLNHPNVKLFVSHGGLMGILEALYSGVPIVGIPLFADQSSNVNFIVQNGGGLQLQLDQIDEQIVYNAISAVLENDTYESNAKQLSRLYRDRERDPLKTAVYWTEYVARHQVRLSLKPASLHMQWYELYSLDVFIAMVVATVSAVYLTKCFISLKR